MAHIVTRRKKNGDLCYRVQVRLKGRPTQSATFTRITDARKWAARTESDIREGRHFRNAEAKRHTLADAIDRYIEEVLPLKPRSEGQQKPQLEWWKERIGAFTLADITPALVVEHRAALLKESEDEGAKSPSTANRYAAVLSHLFTKCVKEWGWMDDSPMRKVDRLPEPRGRVRFLNREKELPDLLAQCRESDNPNLYDAIVLALSTGARKNEIMRLRWPDVDFEHNRIILHETKNGERRALPLASRALECLRQRSRIRRIDCDWVFPAPTKPVPADIDRDFANARDAAGIKDFRFHDLRHSAASYLAMNGATLAEIAEVLGHKTLSMVKRYAHLSEAHTSKVVARMNEALFTESHNDTYVENQ